MYFAISEKIKNRILFVCQVVFFSVIIVLCPIVTLSFAKNGASESSKQTASVNEKSPDEKAESDEGALYEYERPTVEEESYAWPVVKAIIILVIFVAAFYFFYRFVAKKTGMQSVGKDVIKVLSIVPVGQNKFLQVVDLAGRIMVIGVSDSSINLITEIQDRDEIDRIRLLSSKSTPIQPGGFQDYISKYISKLFRKDNPGSARTNRPDETETDRLDYLKKQRDRLKKINGKNDEF